MARHVACELCSSVCASSSDDDAACRLSTEMRVCVLSAVTGFVRPVSLYERTVAVRVAPVPCSSSPAGLPPPRAGVARGGGCGYETHALSLSVYDGDPQCGTSDRRTWSSSASRVSRSRNVWPRITGVLALASCPQRPKFTRNPKFAFKPDWDALRTFGSRLESIPVPIA